MTIAQRLINYVNKGAVRKLIREADGYRDLKKWGDARDLYAKALNKNDKLIGVWVQYGHTLKESNDFKAAEAAYRRALALDDKVADTYLQLGHVLKLQDCSVESSNAYLSAFRLDPNVGNVVDELFSLGWSSADLEQTVGTERLVKRGYKEMKMAMNRLSNDLNNVQITSDYLEQNKDVEKLIKAGFISNAESHFRLYGFSEGRDIIDSLRQEKPSRAFVLCPSMFKQCGIGEHSRYLSIALERSGLEVIKIRRTSELNNYDAGTLKNSLLIVNHGPGLFDGYNPQLSEGESTLDMLANLRLAFEKYQVRPIIFLHSLLDSDNEVMYGRQDMLMRFPIPVATTIESASNHFRIPRVDHGVQQIDIPKSKSEFVEDKYRDEPVIGFFGFFQFGGKDFDSLFEVAKSIKAKLVGSVATTNAWELEKFTEILEDSGVKYDFGSGWVDDSELAKRLSEGDYYYLPQKDYDHWNNSGTARFVMNFEKPVLLPPHHPFLDLRDTAIFCEKDDLPKIVAFLRDKTEYKKASERVSEYKRSSSMDTTMVQLAVNYPNVIDNSMFVGYLTPSALSEQKLSILSDSEREYREQNCMVIKNQWCNASKKGERIKYSVSDEVQVWRRHYDILDLLFVNVDDTIFSIYRNICKREPTLFEYKSAKKIFAAEFLQVDTMPTDMMALLTTLSVAIEENANSYGETPILFMNGEVIPICEILECSHKILEQLVRAATSLLQIENTADFKNTSYDELVDRNLLMLVALPPADVDNALTKAMHMATGRDLKFQVGAVKGLRARIASVVKTLAEHGVTPTEVFLMDEPVVSPVNIGKQIYSLAELMFFDGDDFITNLIRCLCKRNPLGIEFFRLGNILSEHGKINCIDFIASKRGINATVVGNSEEFDSSYSMSNSDYRRFVADFRSPIAGGWSLRNRYLESKRNYSRFWMRTKITRDIWWMQAEGDIGALL